uniref:LYR motif containing 1 n=1 Tax=Anolis carolinensis TaxID=28377 RepID=H9GFM2_ANOCA
MTPVSRQKVLGLYRKIFRIAKKWQSASGQMEETMKEKQYIINEAKTLFQKNKNLTDPELIKQCIEECQARVEIGLHYRIPYPRPVSWNVRGVDLFISGPIQNILFPVADHFQWYFYREVLEMNLHF